MNAPPAANGAAANLGVEPGLQALIDAWHEAHRQLDETYDASCAADHRVYARCPVPQALIATESDASRWGYGAPGRQYSEKDVAHLRVWAAQLS
jgi:hypothetical protein